MMAKRFTDTEKWKKDWFISLSKDAKILWFYITDNCDHAGICDYSEKIFSVMLDFKITKEKINSLLGDKIEWIEENKFRIPSFVDFQYGNLNPQNRVHKSILDKISKIINTPNKGLLSPLKGAKEEDMDKDKEMDKEKEEEEEEEERVQREEEKNFFDSFWSSTNRKGSKQEAFNKFKTRLKTHSLEDIQKAYSQLKKEKSGDEIKYWPDVSGFLNTYFDGYFERATDDVEFKIKETHDEQRQRLINEIPFGGGLPQ